MNACSTHIRTELKIRNTPLNILLMGVVQMAIHNLLSKSERSVEPI